LPDTDKAVSVDLGSGLRAYDIKDIDRWIDSLKEREHRESDDDILAKLDGLNDTGAH